MGGIGDPHTMQVDGWMTQVARTAVRIIACIEDPLVIEKIFTHLDEKGGSAEASRRPPCRAPPQAGLFD